jgi:hypothetical protein
MPLHETYEIEAELTVTLIAHGQRFCNYTIMAKAKAGSDDRTDLTIVQGVKEAVELCAQQADTLAMAARLNRRRELGYGD